MLSYVESSGGVIRAWSMQPGSSPGRREIRPLDGTRQLHTVYDLRYAWQILWECLYDEADCVVAVAASGIKNVDKVASRIALMLRTFAETRGTCLIAIVDSDEEEPEERAAAYYEAVSRKIPHYSGVPPEPASHYTRDLASLCMHPPGAPTLCIASWRCSAECWIALALPEATATTLEPCIMEDRRRCHSAAYKLLNSIKGEPGNVVKRLMEKAREPWGSRIRALAESILDGS